MSDNQQTVFWIRRAVVLVAALLILGLIGFGLSALINSSNQSDSTAIEQTEETEETTDEQDEEIVDCLPGTVSVEAKVGDAEGNSIDGAPGFDPTELPYLWYTVTNNSAVDCNFNVGTAVTFFEITSGDELIWTSRDCDRSMDTNEVGVLKAGATLASPPTSWEKVRSSATGCGAGQRDVITSGASYWFSVELNGVLSESDQQFVLF